MDQRVVRTPEQKRTLVNWGGSLAGIALGALAGNWLLGPVMHNAPLSTLVGIIVGGGIGFEVPDLVRMFRGPHKAQ